MTLSNLFSLPLPFKLRVRKVFLLESKDRLDAVGTKSVYESLSFNWTSRWLTFLLKSSLQTPYAGGFNKFCDETYSGQ